jgi:hypothetical protein
MGRLRNSEKSERPMQLEIEGENQSGENWFLGTTDDFMIGREIRKKFGENWFVGTIKSYTHPKYVIEYEDDDEELMEPSEVISFLVHSNSDDVMIGREIRKRFGKNCYSGIIKSYTHPKYYIQYENCFGDIMNSSDVTRFLVDSNGDGIMIGREIRRKIAGNWLLGIIKSFIYPKYHIQYEDGDEELMESSDVTRFLVQNSEISTKKRKLLVSDKSERPMKIVKSEQLKNDMIGREIRKSFGSHGIFIGKVTSYVHPYYQIKYYKDGDREDLTHSEVMQLLIPV